MNERKIENNRTVLITGANGFIGSYVCRHLLDAGWKVIGVGLKRNDFIPDSRLFMEYSDISNSCDMQNIFKKYTRIDSVIHLAAIVHGKSDDLSWDAYLKINHNASVNIFKLCAEYGIRKIIFSSTVKVYGDVLKGKYNENSFCSPGTFYSKTKLMAENALAKIADEAGIKYAIMRFAPVYANEFRLNLIKRIYLLPGKLGYFFGKGDYRFHFCSIYNICDFILSYLEKKKCLSNIYNIADKQTYSAKELLDFDNKSKVSQCKVIRLPYSLIIGMVYFYERLYRLIINRETTISVSSFRELVANTEYDITRTESVCLLKWNIMNTLNSITQ